MLSIGRLGTTGGAEYYLDKVANGVDDYYLGRGEAPGRWIGASSEALGLVGEVDAATLRNLLAGHSRDGESLGLQLRPERRPGYDLTFSAPKGISLLWAFGPADVKEAISLAHDRVVTSVLEQLSSEACYARRGAGGQRLIDAEGFIAAAFRHRTNRVGDPQLHTHVVVPNLVRGSDDRWSAPDGRQLYAWAKTAGTMYQSALRAELAPLGLAWEVRRNGLGELRDIPKTILRAFSRRRADIEAAMEERGFDSYRSSRTVTLATRERKPAQVVGPDALDERWSGQLAAIEVPDGQGDTRPAAVGDLSAALGRDRAVAAGPEDTEAVLRILAGEAGASLEEWEIDERLGPRALPLTLFGSTFTRREAIAAVSRAFDVTPAEALALTAKLLGRDGVVRVLSDPDVGAKHIEARDSQSPMDLSGERRYTTSELLAAEERIVSHAKASIGLRFCPVAPGVVEAVIEAHPHLDPEQARGVRALLTSGNGIDLVIGQAGTGKSTMLGAARAGWEEAGYKVIGTALAARTAAALEATTGIPSSSLSQVLADLRETGGLTRKHVVVVDEASMVGSRSLDQLRQRVVVAGAKLVLVGDNRQLSSIDAGGALRTLSKELGDHVITLTTNRRQAGTGQQWERDALVALRDGNVVRSVSAYVEHGRVTIARTIDEARRRLVEDWWAVHHEQSTAILAVRRVDVAALNDLVRARRQAAGELGQNRVLGAKAFSVGDRVVFERNQKVTDADRPGSSARIALRNGTFGTVVALSDPARNPPTREGDVARAQGDVVGKGEFEARSAGLVVELDDGRRAVLARDYVENSMSLGYALTVFRAQGITVDHAFGLGGDSLFQEAAYTQLSRGRLSNNLYVTAPENPRWEIGHHAEDRQQREALQGLVEALSLSREKTMARDHLLRYRALSPDDAVAAYAKHAELARWLTEHAPPDVTEELAAASDRSYQLKERGQNASAALSDLKVFVAAQRQRNAWAALHQAEISAWSGLDAELRRYEYRLGQAAAYARPEHLTNLLGPLPDRISATERWQSAAGAIEAYRARWDITGTDGIGAEPTNPEQRDDWRKTVAVVGAAGFLAWGDPGPERSSLAAEWASIRAVDRHHEREHDRGGPELAIPARSRDDDYDSGYDLEYDSGFGL